MNPILENDFRNTATILQKARELSLSYLATLDQTPTGRALYKPAIASLPEMGTGAMQAQDFFKEHFLPHIVASSGSRYWGFVTGGTTPASLAGDWLTSVFDQNPQNVSGLGDVSALLEQETIQMLADLFNLPDTFHGGMVSGATMSNFTGLAVARQWLGKQHNRDIAREGIMSGLKIYASVPHSSSYKALSMLGIGSNAIALIPSLPDRESMDVAQLEAIISRNPAEPFILIASAGTVNTVDFDDLKTIAALKQKYTFWLHIDAAFGAFAACSPTYQHLLQGWEQADSLTIDCHKWLNVPYDSALTFTRKEHALLQTQTFQNANAPYLGNPLENFSYLNFLPENSRRFRALPVWFTLMAYGRKGYQDIVENSIHLATLLGEKIDQSGVYRLVAPVRLNVVCFTVSEESNQADSVKQIIWKLNTRGKVFLTPTVYKGISCLRAAFVNWQTSEKDIEIAMEELLEVCNEVETIASK